MRRVHKHLLHLSLVVAWVSACASAPAPEGNPSAEEGQPISANVTAGARGVTLPSWVSSAGATCSKWTAPTGTDTGSCTSQSTPCRTVGYLVSKLVAGDVGCVAAGTYVENIDWAARAAANGTSTSPIVLRAQDPLNIPTIQSNADSPAFRIQRRYWVIDGFNVNMNGRNHHPVYLQATATGPVDHVAIRNCDIHGAGGVTNATSGITLFADVPNGASAMSDIWIYKNKIHDNVRLTSTGGLTDSHAVNILPDVSKVLVKNNEIYDNSGDGVQCKGPGDNGLGGTNKPADLLFEDNRIYTTAAKQGQTENAYDFKSCEYITVRGVPQSQTGADGLPGLDNSKLYGFRPTPGTSGNVARGEAIVAHYNAAHVLVEGTRIWDSCTGISVGRNETTTTVDSVVLRRNVAFNLCRVGVDDGAGGCTNVPTDSKCDGDAIRVTRANHVDIYHHTIDNVPRSAFRICKDLTVSSTCNDVEVWNNAVRNAPNWLDLTTSKFGQESSSNGFESNYNRFWNGSTTDTSHFLIDGTTVDLTTWRSKASGPTIVTADQGSAVADPMFVTGAGSTADYCTNSGSSLRNTASSVDGSGVAACNGAKDVGFLETDCATCPP